MTKQTLDSKGYETVTMQVGKITAKVSGVKNGLNTSTSHLKVAHIQTIFQIYNDLSRLVSAYGELVAQDLQEFRQVGVNIQQTDREVSK